MSDFEEWCEKNLDMNDVWEDLRVCYKSIKELEDKLKKSQERIKILTDLANEAVKVVEFYGDNNNWYRNYSGNLEYSMYEDYTIIEPDDTSEYDENKICYGGETARRFLNSDIYKQYKTLEAK